MFGTFMVSFDVESLFTNIPLEECIDLAVNYISNYSEPELRSFFTIATAQTHFLCNGSFYDQIDSVSMGSHLAPVLANLFMGHHEKLWLEIFQGSEMLFYRRYLVDDTFCLFHSEHDGIMFFDYINSRHPNIRFTMEKDHFSVVTQKKIRHFIKRYCNDLDIKLVFSSFKIGNLLGVKDPIPGGLRSCVVYNFACAGCNACYVGKTIRHFSTRVREHLVSDRASHIFKHLQNSEQCRGLSSGDCFHILDHASTTFQLKIKEAFHIQREQPSLNQQVHHVNLKLSF